MKTKVPSILDEPPKPHPDHPRNSWEFITLFHIDPYEGVIVTSFPPKITKLGTAGDHHPFAQWINVQAILGDMEGLDTRLIDLLPDPLETKIKWWRVREFAREHGYNLMPEEWNGGAADIPDKYFEPERYTGVRLYHAGPWVWPVLRPEMTLEPDADEEKLLAIAKDYKL